MFNFAKFFAVLLLLLNCSLIYGQAPIFSLDYGDAFQGRLRSGVLSAHSSPAEPQFKSQATPDGGRSVLLSADEDLSFQLDPSWFNIDRGSLVFWLKPLGWGNKLRPAADANHYIPIFAIDGGNGGTWTQHFYVAYSNMKENGDMQVNYRSMLDIGKERRQVYAQNALRENLLTANEWSHVVLTWNSMEVSAYINGTPVGSVSYGLPVEKTFNSNWKMWFMPKQFWRMAKKDACELGPLKIYDQPFTETRVKELYDLVRGASVQRKQSLAVAPLSARSPSIDGHIDHSEWADASMFPLGCMNGSGVFNSDFEALVYLKHDGKNLLVGFEAKASRILPGAPDNSFGQEVFRGSEFELSWRGLGRPEAQYCQLAIAPNNAWAFRNADGQWLEPPVSRQARVTEQGWSAELELPFSLLELDQPGPIYMQFCMLRPEYNDLMDRWVCWNVEKPLLMFFHNMGRVELRNDGLNTRLAWPGKLNYGDYDINLRSSKKTSYKLDLKGAGIDFSEQGQLPEDGGKWRGKAPGTGMVDLDLQLSETDKPVFQMQTRFQVKEAISLQIRSLASEKKILANVDLQGAEGLLSAQLNSGGIPYHLLLTDENNRVVAESKGLIQALASELELDVGELPEGAYRVELKVWEGENLMSRSRPFIRPSDVFLRQRKGLEPEPPFPYSALKYAAESISTLQTEYFFSEANPFPSAVNNAGEAVLDTPMQLLIQIDGKEQGLQALSETVLQRADEQYRCRGLMQSQDGRVKLEWLRYLAYDGMLRYDLRLLPDSTPVNINSLQVKTILPAENARYSLSPNFQEDWQSKGLVQAFPSLWATGTRRGLCLFSDNDANWFSDKNTDPLEMRRLPDGRVALTAKLIDGKVSLKEAATYVLGIIATPAKPLRGDWRDIHDSGWGQLLGQNIQVVGWTGMGYNPFYRGIDFSQPNPPGIAHWEKTLANRRAKVTKLIPYTFMNAIPDENPIFDFYYGDWQRKVGGVVQPRHDYCVDKIDQTVYYTCNPVCPNNSEYVDFMAYYVDRYLQDYQVFVGLYTDGGGMTSTDLPYKQTSLRDVFRADKKVRNYSMFGARDAYERFYKIIRKHRGQEGLMFTHSWDKYYPAINSFYDLIYPGEEYMHSIQKGLHVYIEETPLEKWQSNYNSRIYGAGVQFLTQYRKFGGDLSRMEPEMRRQYTKPCLMMCLIHDVPMTGAWYAAVEDYWRLFAELQVGKAEFVGYWEQGGGKSDDEKVKLSYYRWPGNQRLLLMLGNLKRQSAAVRVAIPGFDLEQYQASEAFEQKPLDLNAPILVEDFGFKVLLLEK